MHAPGEDASAASARSPGAGAAEGRALEVVEKVLTGLEVVEKVLTGLAQRLRVLSRVMLEVVEKVLTGLAQRLCVLSRVMLGRGDALGLLAGDRALLHSRGSRTFVTD